MPKGWADAESIEKFAIVSASEPLYPDTTSIAVDEQGQLTIVGGSDGIVGVYSIPENKIQATFKAGSAITDSAWFGEQPVVSTASGTVKVFGNNEATFTSHAGRANRIALHPSGEILGSVGVDKSFVLYDLVNGKAVTQVYTDSGKISSMRKYGTSTKNLQNLPRLLSILMATYLPLEVLMVRSRCSTSKPEKVLQPSI